jgi:hypothetical protein
MDGVIMTDGFYKLQDGELFHAINRVSGAYGSFTLDRHHHEDHEYPVDGWYWFESMEEARAFFGLPEIPDESETNTI